MKECKKCHGSFPDEEVKKHPSMFVEVCKACYAEFDAIDAETKQICEERKKAEKERILALRNAPSDLDGYEHVKEEKDPVEILLDEQFAQQLKEKHDRILSKRLRSSSARNWGSIQI